MNKQHTQEAHPVEEEGEEVGRGSVNKACGSAESRMEAGERWEREGGDGRRRREPVRLAVVGAYLSTDGRGWMAYG